MNENSLNAADKVLVSLIPTLNPMKDKETGWFHILVIVIGVTQ